MNAESNAQFRSAEITPGRAPRWMARKFEHSDDALIVHGRMTSIRPLVTATIHMDKFRDASWPGAHASITLEPYFRWARLWKARKIDPFSYRFTARLPIDPGATPSSIFELYVSADGQRARSMKSPVADLVFHPSGQSTYLAGYDPVALAYRVEKIDVGKSELATLHLTKRGDTIRCVIGEYPFSARDNGYALFRALKAGGHAYRNEVAATYSVEANNQDNVAPGDGVVAFGTREHMQACIDADVVLTSHDARNCYPRLAAKLRGDFPPVIFLGHGVTGLKGGMHRVYGKSRAAYSRVVVTSESERSIFCRHFGYANDEVVIAGLPRHDFLLEGAQTIQAEANRILVFPTWRPEFLHSNFDIESSDFVAGWSAAMQCLRSRGLKVTYMVHPLAGPLRSYLAPFADETATASEFQSRLVQSSALLTDYSSVAYEALYLSKPAFFLQFDRQAYFEKHKPYLDFDRELPGPSSPNPDGIADIIAAWASRGWRGEHDQKVTFKYRDTKNSERISNLIREVANCAQ